ncbi:unnamed protein product, partial [Didymodactylos carnosus]
VLTHSSHSNETQFTVFLNLNGTNIRNIRKLVLHSQHLLQEIALLLEPVISGKQCLSCSFISIPTYQQLIHLLNFSLLNLSSRTGLLYLLKSISNDLCTYFVSLHKNCKNNVTPNGLWTVLKECCHIPSTEVVNELLESMTKPKVIPAWDIAPELEIVFYRERSISHINWPLFFNWLGYETDDDTSKDIVVPMSFNSWSHISDYMKTSDVKIIRTIQDLTTLFDTIKDLYQFDDLLYDFTLLSSIDPTKSDDYQTLVDSLEALKRILTKFLQFTHLKHAFTQKVTWIQFKLKLDHMSYYEPYISPVYSFYYNHHKLFPPFFSLKPLSHQPTTIDNDIDINELIEGESVDYLWCFRDYLSTRSLREQLYKMNRLD